jgi:peptide methionine sulfoxide reductase MsrB
VTINGVPCTAPSGAKVDGAQTDVPSDGLFVSAVSGLPLFASRSQFEPVGGSGSSGCFNFYAPLDAAHIVEDAEDPPGGDPPGGRAGAGDLTRAGELPLSRPAPRRVPRAASDAYVDVLRRMAAALDADGGGAPPARGAAGDLARAGERASPAPLSRGRGHRADVGTTPRRTLVREPSVARRVATMLRAAAAGGGAAPARGATSPSEGAAAAEARYHDEARAQRRRPIRDAKAGTLLGYVVDGCPMVPEALGGRRYVVHGAALCFVPEGGPTPRFMAGLNRYLFDVTAFDLPP